MAGLLTLEGTLRQLREGIDGLAPRARRELEEYASDLEDAFPADADMSAERRQEVLARRLEQKPRIIAFHAEAEPLFKDLEAAGIDIDKIPRLRRPGAGSVDALPPLLNALATANNRALVWQIIDVLGEQWAGKAGTDALKRKFESLSAANDPEPNTLRSMIVTSLAKHYSDVGLSWFLGVARNEANGESRFNAVLALAKFSRRKNEVVPALMSFLDSEDGELIVPAAEVLGRWKITAARPRLAELTSNVEARHQAHPRQAFAMEFERDELRKAMWKIAPDTVD